MKALSMHIQKSYQEIIVLVLIAVNLSKNKIFQPDSLMHMFNASILYKQSIKLLH